MANVGKVTVDGSVKKILTDIFNVEYDLALKWKFFSSMSRLLHLKEIDFIN